MSRLSGLVTPDLRAAIEAALAKLAPPACATPMTKHPSSTRHPTRTRSAAITARQPNATTTECWPDCAA